MDEMKSVFNLFAELQATTKKNEKVEILERGRDNELFTTTLRWLLNPYIKTGVSTAKLHKDVSALQNKPLMYISWSDVMKYLDKNNTGRDVDIAFIQDFLMTKSIEDKWHEQLITKSLKLGVDATTVNKVYGKGFVPTFEVQLGTPIDKCKLNGNEKIYISQKLNGCRNLYYEGKCYTRTGNEYEGIDHIIADIKQIIPEGIVLDGELIRKNDGSISDSANFQIGTGLANSKDGDKSVLEYVVFDYITDDDFRNGESKATYDERKASLLRLDRIIKDKGVTNVRIVPMWYEGYDHSEIWKWLEYAEQNDYEGAIINLDVPYYCKRVKSLIKVKQFYNVDLCCTGLERGTGKNSNTLGAIICDYKGNELRVGSGFTDEQRNFYWNNPDEIVGKIVEIKYKEESTNKNGGLSLQFPVFICVRFDKDEISMN